MAKGDESPEGEELKEIVRLGVFNQPEAIRFEAGIHLGQPEGGDGLAPPLQEHLNRILLGLAEILLG
jgi:hypothetical protein